MCNKISCSKCKGATWTSCGQHVKQVLAGIPKNKLCSCKAKEPTNFQKTLFKILGGKI